MSSEGQEERAEDVNDVISQILEEIGSSSIDSSARYSNGTIDGAKTTVSSTFPMIDSR